MRLTSAPAWTPSCRPAVWVLTLFLIAQHGLTDASSKDSIPLLPFDPPPGPDPYFAICAIVKNQHEDLCEWIYYHQHVLNISRIYFWDHNSDPPQHDIIAQCSKPDGVVYRYLPNIPKSYSRMHHVPQLYAYNRCLGELGARHKFMAFIDVDEFITLPGEQQNLTHILQQAEPYGCLALNWRLFGSSGHMRRPPGGVLENYFKCEDGQAQGRHTKLVVNTQYAVDAWNPHAFNFKDGKYCVNENLQRVHVPYSEVYSASTIGLNHYVVKSHEDWTRKRRRGSAMGQRKREDYFRITDRGATQFCNESLAIGRQVAAEVKQLMGELKGRSSGDATFWEKVKADHHSRLFPPEGEPGWRLWKG